MFIDTDDLDDYFGQPNYDSADDENSDGVSEIYTVIATGKVESGGVTVARRQIKVFAKFPNPDDVTVYPDSNDGGVSY